MQRLQKIQKWNLWQQHTLEKKKTTETIFISSIENCNNEMRKPIIREYVEFFSEGFKCDYNVFY